MDKRIWTVVKALEISYAQIKAYSLGIWRDQKKIMTLNYCGFRKKSFSMNAPLVSWAYLSSFWVDATTNPSKSDDRYARLTRGAFLWITSYKIHILTQRLIECMHLIFLILQIGNHCSFPPVDLHLISTAEL